MKNLKSLLLLAFTILSVHVSAQYQGDWIGNLETHGTSLPIVFHISKTGNEYTATMDSPKQNAFGLKVQSVTENSGDIVFDMSDLGIRYKAQLKADSLIGEFSQGGQNHRLNLGRMEKMIEAPKRPQEPKPKFNYNIENVIFENEIGLKLAGTLTIPKGKGPFPAVVLISGSGPQNRDEELFGHKPFWVIADHLTRNGIAVLRYDDRGTGQSQGDFSAGTSRDFATDAKGAVEFLRKQNKVNANKIGLVGHSEGGMIAPMLAAEDEKIGFIILLAGPGIPIDQLMMKQADAVLRSSGANEAEIKETSLLNEKCYAILKSSIDEETSKAQISELLKSKFSDPKVLKQSVDQAHSPWFKYFISYNPQPVLEQVKCAVLAINGDKDIQVSSVENLEGIKQSLEKAGNKNFKIYEAKNMNHLFQTTQTGLVEEYGELEETFSPEILDLMTKWILGLK